MPRDWRVAMEKAKRGQIAFLDHPWKGRRVLKVLCADRDKLVVWGREHGLNEKYIHDARIPHFDLRGPYRLKFLKLLHLDD